MIVRKAFKYRIYPNQKQQAALSRQFGHARFVYNYYRAAREGFYLDTGETLRYRSCADDLADILKDEYPWLREADSQVLQQSLKDLDRAYINFFAGHAGYPQFKRKHHKQSIRYPQRFKVNGPRVYLPKVGWLKAVFHRPIEGRMKNCTVSKTKSGKYFIALQCEVAIDAPPVRDGRVGVDLGLKEFVALSNGEKVPPPHYLRRAERRLKIRQRCLSRKIKGTNNRAKARRAVAIQHEKVANQRRDFHHKLSHDLVERFGFIAFENLNVNGMLKNHCLAKAIADAGWSQFVRFCRYKAKWTGGRVEKRGRFFASSKLCSACGAVNHRLKLSDRVWTCLDCGATHDRDENAAINILKGSTGGAPETYASGDTISVGKSAQEAQCL